MSLRIGITIGLHHEAETLWNNGIKQNAVFLAEALKQCTNVASVVLVNTTAVPVTPQLPWDLGRWPTCTWDDAKDRLNVLIELGGQITPQQTDYLKQRGCRLVSYCCGSEYVLAMESMLFGRALWGSHLFVNQRYDAIWMVPQVAHISQAYFEVLRRQQAQSVPFVWSPVFLEERTRHLPHGGVYQPRGNAPRRLVVMEPNHNVVKFCLYPVLMAELVYRARPDAVEMLYVTNAERMANKSREFVSLMNQLDIVRARKAVFPGRFDTPSFLAEYADIVLSHQWENPLNYFYLEVCWQGYPLVHNATLCQDLGYYYPDNEVQAGADQVLRVMEGHDGQADAYRHAQRALIDRYLPGNQALQQRYVDLLDQVIDAPIR